MRRRTRREHQVTCDSCGVITVVQYAGMIARHWLLLDAMEADGEEEIMEMDVGKGVIRTQRDLCPGCKYKFVHLFRKGKG